MIQTVCLIVYGCCLTYWHWALADNAEVFIDIDQQTSELLDIVAHVYMCIQNYTKCGTN